MHKIFFLQKVYFMPLHVSSTCAHRQEFKISLHCLWYHRTCRCDDTRGCVMLFWPPDVEHMCSKHVEAWNKLFVKHLCIILVNYWDKYTERHGQQDVNLCVKFLCYFAISVHSVTKGKGTYRCDSVKWNLLW